MQNWSLWPITNNSSRLQCPSRAGQGREATLVCLETAWVGKGTQHMAMRGEGSRIRSGPTAPCGVQTTKIPQWSRFPHYSHEGIHSGASACHLKEAAEERDPMLEQDPGMNSSTWGGSHTEAGCWEELQPAQDLHWSREKVWGEKRQKVTLRGWKQARFPFLLCHRGRWELGMKKMSLGWSGLGKRCSSFVFVSHDPNQFLSENKLIFPIFLFYTWWKSWRKYKMVRDFLVLISAHKIYNWTRRSCRSFLLFYDLPSYFHTVFCWGEELG